MEFTDPKVTREDLEFCPRDRDTFDKGVVLVFECQHGFVEDNSFIFFSKHAHKALHEILGYHQREQGIFTTGGLPELHPKHHHLLQASSNGVVLGQ